MQRFFYSILFLLVSSSVLSAQTIRYVKARATGAGNGSSWQDASEDLQGMINASNGNNGDMVFVAAGIYRPRTAAFPVPFSRENSFRVDKNIKVYGGFPADGGDFTQRDWVTHKSVLSGDLNQNDQHGAEFNDDNCYHVLVTDGSSVNSECVIDGFTVIGGNADHSTVNSYQQGGGWYNGSSSPTIRNLIITGNSAAGGGGGWYNALGSPRVENLEIRNNTANLGGGWCNSSEVSPSVKNVRIWDNHAKSNGGGVYIGYTPGSQLENVSIRGNTAERGGGLYQFDGTAVLVNSEITGNVAQRGAGVYSVTAVMNLINCTIVGNASESEVMWVSNAFINLFNCILAYNASPQYLNPYNRFHFENSFVSNQSYEDAFGNLSGILNPGFVYLAMAEYSSDPGFSKATFQGDFSLLPCSPLLDKGKNTFLAPDWDTDLAGRDRTQNGTVDLGAFEFQSNGSSFSEVYVDITAAPGGDGRSWETALNSFAQAVQMSNGCEELETIHVARGTYYPEHKISNRADDRDKAFGFNVNRVQVLGGYPSGGGATRDAFINKTILSGDIDRNGIVDDGNSFHVVTFGNHYSLDNKITFDGVVIEGGNANETSFDLVPFWSSLIYNSRGGGVYSYDSFVRFNNVMVRGNVAEEGGGIYHRIGGFEIYNSVISGNRAIQYGGGVYVSDGWMTPYNATVSGNSAGNSGGGWYTKLPNQLMIGTIITGNTGGQSPDFSGIGSDVLVHTFIDHTFYTPPAVVTHFDQGSILNPTTLRLIPGSPAINAGASYDAIYEFPVDMAGRDRILGNAIDIGAFEYDPSNPLPVSLINFHAVRTEKQTVLTWSTASEIKASHFEIERSSEGGIWTKIGQLKSDGDSASLRHYRYLDASSLAGVNYYRLKTLDLDGSFSYSNIVSVSFAGQSETVKVYPTIVESGSVTISVSGTNKPDLTILDLKGRQVGTKVIHQSDERTVFDVSHLSSGVYLVAVRGQQLTVKRFIIK